MLHVVAHEPGRCFDLRLLGTFGLRIDRRTVQVGSPKLRTLFAALAMQAGETISLDELVRAVWNDAQPDNPRRAIQLYVTRLRGLLTSAHAAEIITTFPNGYRINVEPEQTDLGRFQCYLSQAKEAASGGDLEAESSALGQALAQWRGEPFVDTPSDLLHREVAPRLVEQRLRALERRFALELSRGRSADIIDDLLALTAKYPLRERLWAQLMTALADSGRRPEALEAYHAIRQRLADELGVDPGKELRLLFARVLSEAEAEAEAGGAVRRFVMVDSIAELEGSSTEVRSWQAQILPKLLQTEDYAQALRCRSSSPEAESRDRRLLARGHARTLDFILDEAILHRPVGGAHVMLGQLHALLRSCARADLSIRVVPISIGEHAEIGRGSFSILAFRRPLTPDVVVVESAAGGILVKDPEQVRACKATFARITDVALDERDSATLIAEIARSERYTGSAVTKCVTTSPTGSVAPTGRAGHHRRVSAATVRPTVPA